MPIRMGGKQNKPRYFGAFLYLCNYAISIVTIEQLATDERLLRTAQIYGGEYARDIVQDTILVMLELPEEKMSAIRKDNALLVYAQKVALHLSRRMYNSARNPNDNLITGIDLSFVEDNEECDPIDDVEYAIETLYGKPKKSEQWYKRELLKTYCRLGSLRKVQEETGLDYSSVFRTIKEVKDEIRFILGRDC